jgi:cyclic pyranopterin phosphate synthase
MSVETWPALVDAFGREVRSLRLSITDRCNLRCRYCMPAEGLAWIPSPELLTRSELRRLVAVLASLGVRDVRITGGEPLVRSDAVDIVHDVATVAGIEEVSLTTNGVLLADRLDALVAAGLARVNLSLDSLDPDRFEAVTRRRELERVLAGLAACERHPGLGRVKVNAVLLRGLGEADVLPLAEMARTRPVLVRFIEAMPIDADRAWRMDDVLSGEWVRRRIAERWPLEQIGRERPSAPATRWRFADGAGEVHFVSSVTEPFCASCDRVRLTADGQMRTCLFASEETDLRSPLRAGASDAEIAGLMAGAVAGKPAGHGIGTPGWSYDGRPMSRIGG